MKSFFQQSCLQTLALLFSLIFCQTADAAISSKQSGNWNSASTWIGGVVPNDQDDVIIKSGHTVTRSNAFVSQGYLYVYGTMVYTGNVAREFYVGHNVEIQGTLRIEGGSMFFGGIVYGNGLFKQTSGNTTFFKAVVLENTEILGGTAYYQNINNGNLHLDYLTLKNAEIKTDGNENLHIIKTMLWQHNGKFDGDLQIDQGAVLTLESGLNYFYHKGNLYNYGTVSIGTGTFTSYSATSQIYNYGVWKLNVEADSKSNISNVSFVNQADGQLIKTGLGPAELSTLACHGKLHVQQGNIKVHFSIHIQEGFWQIDNGQELQIVSAAGDNDYVKFWNSQITNNGKLYGRIKFMGDGLTTLQGNSIYDYVDIAKDGDIVDLKGDMKVLKGFTLTTSQIVLNQYNLTLALPVVFQHQGNIFSYVRTNSTGGLILNCVSGKIAEYWVGDNKLAPLKIILSNTNEAVKVRVTDSFYGEYTGNTPACSEEVPLGIVDHTWFVTSLAASPGKAIIKAYWQPAAEQLAFNNGQCTLAKYEAGDWKYGEFVQAGWYAPFYTVSALTIVTGIFGVFDKEHEEDVNFIAPHASADVNPVCELEDMQLFAATSSNALVHWTGPNSFHSNEHNPFFENIQASRSGLYQVTAVQYGCPEKKSAITVTVNQLPGGYVAGPTQIQTGESAELVANGGSAYLWSTGDTTKSILVKPAKTTHYFVTITNNAGCSMSVWHTLQVSGTTAVTETNEILQKTNIIPNPVTGGNAVLSFESAVPGQSLLNVSDPLGRTVFQKVIQLAEGLNSVDLPVAGMPAGIYWVTLAVNNQVKTHMLAIQVAN